MMPRERKIINKNKNLVHDACGCSEMPKNGADAIATCVEVRADSTNLRLTNLRIMVDEKQSIGLVQRQESSLASRILYAKKYGEEKLLRIVAWCANAIQKWMRILLS
jgi:hypothetical protein